MNLYERIKSLEAKLDRRLTTLSLLKQFGYDTVETDNEIKRLKNDLDELYYKLGDSIK